MVRSNQRHAVLTQAVVRVGEGRGFVVDVGEPERAVITAAHCLPSLPACHPASYLHERTYAALLGPLGSDPIVWAECLFADPIADIAVIGSPDNQTLSEEAEAYEHLLASTTPLLIAGAPKEGREVVRVMGQQIERQIPMQGSALLLSLGAGWVECSITRWKMWLSIEPEALVVSGMSGSPIVSMTGQAIGLISTGSRLNPVLTDSLPGRLLRNRVEKSELKS